MMRTELFGPLVFCGFAAVSLVCGIVAWPMLSAAWPSIEEKIDWFRRLSPLAKLLQLLFVGAFVVYGSTKTNLVDQTSGTNEVEIVGGGGQSNLTTCAYGLKGGVNFLCPSPLDLSTCYPDPTVTPEDIARGWRLCEVRTNSNISYAMPGGATLATNWWVRGAYEDVKKTGLGGLEWRFPLGANEYDSAWAFTWGKLRFVLGDAETEIVAVGAPMSAVPYCSRLWSVADTNGARIVTWENFVLGRALKEDVDSFTSGETPLPLCCAQIELRSTGDFVTRSNEVETVYRRVDPEDWDGDGWENGDDSDPYAWEDFREDFLQELPDGANTNAYCWIEIRPRWNSWIEFYGDAPSDLSDPRFWAKAGKTYRVQLLIGKTYGVASTQPFDILARSDERIEVTEFGTDQAEVIWPVEFTVAEGRAPTGRPRLGATWNDGGKSFHVLPDPPWLCGEITWTNDVCCSVWGDGTNFTYACDNTCHCEGCTVYGNYWYEGYRLPVWGIPCGCRRVPDHGPAGVSVSFDRHAVIYEDAYTNKPGEVVHPARTNVVLRCSVRGGTYGGTLSVTLNAAAQQKLCKVCGDTLPQDVRIESGTSSSYEVVYAVQEPSDSVRDIVAAAVFHEDFLNVDHTNDTSMTSVKVELEAVYEAPANPNPSRHIYGVGEKVKLKHSPQSIGLEWGIGTEDLWSVLEAGDGCDKILKLHYLGGTITEVVGTCCGEEYRPSIAVYEPESVLCLSHAWDGLCSPLGVAGGFGMDLWLSIGPMHLSFQGIDVAEIPCETVIPPTGYYATTNFNGVLTHNLDAGAGFWHHVSTGNYWCVDNAQSNIRRQQWSNGRLQWNIPIQWYQRLESAESWSRGFVHADGRLIGGSLGAYKQEFDITADGTVMVTKHQHWIDRNTNDVIRLDGVLVHDGEHRR